MHINNKFSEGITQIPIYSYSYIRSSKYFDLHNYNICLPPAPCYCWTSTSSLTWLKYGWSQNWLKSTARSPFNAWYKISWEWKPWSSFLISNNKPVKDSHQSFVTIDGTLVIPFPKKSTLARAHSSVCNSYKCFLKLKLVAWLLLWSQSSGQTRGIIIC